MYICTFIQHNEPSRYLSCKHSLLLPFLHAQYDRYLSIQLLSTPLQQGLSIIIDKLYTHNTSKHNQMGFHYSLPFEFWFKPTGNINTIWSRYRELCAKFRHNDCSSFPQSTSGHEHYISTTLMTTTIPSCKLYIILGSLHNSHSLYPREQWFSLFHPLHLHVHGWDK